MEGKPVGILYPWVLLAECNSKDAAEHQMRGWADRNKIVEQWTYDSAGQQMPLHHLIH
jgi:hypothetical protein